MMTYLGVGYVEQWHPRLESYCWVAINKPIHMRNGGTTGHVRIHRGDKGRSKTYLVHRWSYFWTYGGIPEGMCILHHCDVPACFNPQHLYAGTKADNGRDAATRGRAAKPLPEYCKKGLHRMDDNPLLAKAPHTRSGMSRQCRACLSERRRRTYALRKAATRA